MTDHLDSLFKGPADGSCFFASEPAGVATSTSTCSGEAAAAPAATVNHGVAAPDGGLISAIEQEAEKLVLQYCSVPKLCRHPRQAALEAQARAWFSDLYGPRLPATRVQRMLDTRLETLGCVFYPSGLSDARTLTCIKLMYWILLDDDVFDDPHLLANDYNAAHRFACRQFRAMFGEEIMEAQAVGLLGPHGYDAGLDDNDADLRTVSAADEMARAQQELAIEVGVQFTSEMQALGLSPRQVERLREAVAEDLLGVSSVVRLRQEKRLPTVEEYIKLRRMDGGYKLVLLGCEFDIGMDLDDKTLQHPLIQKLNITTCDHCLWLNDLVSFKRECHNNDYVSLLGALHYNNNKNATLSDNSSSTTEVDFQEAVAEAQAMIKACDEERMSAIHDILEWRPDLQPYVEAANVGVAGLIYWTLFSSRYQQVELL